MIRTALLSLLFAGFALRASGEAGVWALEAMRVLPQGVQFEEAAGVLNGDHLAPAGPSDALWILGSIHEQGDWVVAIPEALTAQAWALTRGGRWRPLSAITPARHAAFVASEASETATKLLFRVPAAHAYRVEALSPEQFASQERWFNGLLAFVFGALTWVGVIALYIRLRLKRWRVEGLIWMTALVQALFLMRSGGFHILAPGGWSGAEHALALLVDGAAFPWAIWALRRARPKQAFKVRPLVFTYLIAWVLLALGSAYDVLPVGLFPCAFHALSFGCGVYYLGQIRSRPTPLQLTFLTLVLAEGMLAFGAFVSVSMAWSVWFGALLALLGLTWSLVRVVNEGFAQALGLVAEKHENDALRQRAYTRGLEEEKRRIAGELHDDVLGGLVLLQHSLPLNDPARGSLQGAISKIRGLTVNLSPHGVVDMGFSEALERLANSYRTEALKVWLHVHADPKNLSERAHFELFRMAQEVLQNSYKHAGADRVDISLDWDKADGMLLLTIEDNGVGFDVAEVKKSGRGIGLENLKSRAQAIGAHLNIESAPGSGTYIAITYNTALTPDR